MSCYHMRDDPAKPEPNDTYIYIFSQLVQDIMHQQYQALNAEHVSTCKSSGGWLVHVSYYETREAKAILNQVFV